MTSFKQKIKEETSLVLGNAASQKSEILTEKEITHLPAPIQKWLKVSGAVGKEKVRTVALYFCIIAISILVGSCKNGVKNGELIFTEGPAGKRVQLPLFSFYPR